LALGGSATAAVSDATVVNGIKLMTRKLGDMDSKTLKGLVDDNKSAVGSGVIALISINGEGKASLYVGVTPDLTSRLNAVDLVRAGSAALGGKGGGGRPDLAQAGGPEGARADEAFAAIAALIK
jgi:alanyl-tRNA synthetase